MYIRYNNSSNRHAPHNPPPKNQPQYQPFPKQQPCPPPKKEEKKQENRESKNPLKFLPKEIYNPETHKFFGKISSEDILIVGLILLILDSGCKDDLPLALALLYILLSDYLDFGNIFS